MFAICNMHTFTHHHTCRFLGCASRPYIRMPQPPQKNTTAHQHHSPSLAELCTRTFEGPSGILHVGSCRAGLIMSSADLYMLRCSVGWSFGISCLPESCSCVLTTQAQLTLPGACTAHACLTCGNFSIIACVFVHLLLHYTIPYTEFVYTCVSTICIIYVVPDFRSCSRCLAALYM